MSYLKILFAIRGDIDESNSGTEVFARDLSEKLRQLGNQIDIFCATTSPSFVPETRIGKSFLYRVPGSRIPFISSLLYEFQALIFWISHIRNAHYDAVISFGVGGSLALSKLLTTTKTPIIYYAIDTMKNEYLGKKSSLSLPQQINYYGKIILDRYFCRISDLVFCSCQNTLNSIASQYQINKTKLRLLYFGVNKNSFPPEKSPLLNFPNRDLLLIANDHTRKGSFFLVECLKFLASRSGLKLSATIVGDRNTDLEKMIKTSRLDIELVPIQPHSKLIKLYQKFKCHVVPSVSEGFCLPVIEAAMCARPSVVTQVGSLPELVVGGKTGYVSSRQVEIFSRILSKIVKDELWQRLGRQAYLNAAKFEITLIAKLIDKQIRLIPTKS